MKHNISFLVWRMGLTSSHMWMTLLGVKILKMRKRMRVMLRNTMMRVEAPLAMPPVTAFTSAAMVGTGRGVGVVGGGTGRMDHQKNNVWKICVNS